MAINPFRLTEMPLVPNPKPVPLDFSFISNIGDVIGKVREQRAVGDLMASAVDDSGNLDLNKAARALATSGRDPIPYLNVLARQQDAARQVAAQKALEAHYRATEEQGRQGLELRKQELEQGKTSEFSIEDPLGVKEAKRFRLSPKSGLQQIYPPAPAPAPAPVVPAPVVPGPSGAVEDLPGLAPMRTAVAAPNPEEAPPYQVAGPPTPPPAPTPEPSSAREIALANFARDNGPDAAAIFRDVLDYKRGLPGDDKIKQRWITAARSIDPTFDPSKFEEQKKAATESQAKMALYANRALRAEEVMRMPDVEGAGTNFRERFAGNVPFVGNYMVGPSFQRFDQASRDLVNAFLRPESGAAISQSEFDNAYKQYIPAPGDSPQKLADKRAAREREIAGIISGAGQNYVPSHVFEKGQLLPNPKAPAAEAAPPTVAQIRNDAEANKLIGQARAALKRDPGARDEVVRMLRERGVRNPELMLGR